MNEVVGLVPVVQTNNNNNAIVRPAVNVEQALAAWKDYQELVSNVLDQNDLQKIQGKDFKKKSAWRKLATFFNLTVEELKCERFDEEDGSFSFDVVCKAIAPNGRSVIGDGSANSREKNKEGDFENDSRHNVRSTAFTRAFNRAVSNLIGGGEVSAEEADQTRSSYTREQSYTKPITINSSNDKVGPGYTIKFGKYKTKRLSEIPSAALMGYAEWCTRNIKDQRSNAYLEAVELMQYFMKEEPKTAAPAAAQEAFLSGPIQKTQDLRDSQMQFAKELSEEDIPF
jgi:hypothetical protein